MQRRLWSSLLVGLALVAAGCGGSDDEPDDATIDVVDDDPAAESGEDGATDPGDAEGSTGNGDDSGDDAAPAADDVPDDEDAAEILGDPDLDLDELPDEVAEALDDIDDIVSIGDCASEVLGLAFTAPEGWRCRVLDVSLGGVDGFTLFTEGNELNITVGTPSPIQACEVLQACDTAEPVDLGAQWPGGQRFDFAGTTTIWASHATVDAEVVVTKVTALSDDELAFVRSVLDTTTEVG